MRKIHHRTWLFIFTTKVIKYLLLALFSFAMVCLVTPIFSGFQTVEILFNLVGQWFRRLGIIALCLMGSSVVVESLRN